MPTWIRKFFRDPRTAFATAAAIMSAVGLLCGVIGIGRILWALQHR